MEHKDSAEIIEIANVDEFKCLLDQMDMIITSKMHPAVLGASGFVPILCIAYDHKQTGFFARLNMADCAMEIQSLSYQTLREKMDYVWNNRLRISQSLRDTIPRWQENVEKEISNALAPYVESHPNP
jgi:polysaccharide pyruvyl transferase WcaK-like protein